MSFMVGIDFATVSDNAVSLNVAVGLEFAMRLELGTGFGHLLCMLWFLFLYIYFCNSC